MARPSAGGLVAVGRTLRNVLTQSRVSYRGAASFKQVRRSTKRLGRRLYRIETGGKDTRTQMALFNRLGSLPVTPRGARGEASKKLGREAKHFFTAAGWKQFGAKAYESLVTSPYTGVGRPKILRRRTKAGFVKIPADRYSSLKGVHDPWQVYAGGGIGGAAITGRKRRSVKSGGRSQLKRRRKR